MGINDFTVGCYIDLLSSNLRHRLTIFSDKNTPWDKVLKGVETYFRANEALLQELFSLRNKHRYTYEHSLNVAFYAMLVGMHNRLSVDDLKVLCIGGILHDLGKNSIDIKILDKPSGLTDEEFDVIKQHPQNGVVFFQNTSNSFEKRIKTVIEQHHEKLNGTGYPLGLHSNRIDDLSKIVTVADIFDAVTAKRSYHNSKTIIEGMRVLLDGADRDELDINVVSAFIETITYPVIFMKMQHDNKNVEKLEAV